MTPHSLCRLLCPVSSLALVVSLSIDVLTSPTNYTRLEILCILSMFHGLMRTIYLLYTRQSNWMNPHRITYCERDALKEPPTHWMHRDLLKGTSDRSQVLEVNSMEFGCNRDLIGGQKSAHFEMRDFDCYALEKRKVDTKTTEHDQCSDK